MSKLTDSVNRELYKFLEQENPGNKKELEQKVAEFQERWNENIQKGGDGHFMDSDSIDEAYDLLERAEDAESIVEARKLARQAYRKSPECFDAVIFLAQHAPNLSEANNIIDKGLASEEERLKREGLWIKENIGNFYTMFESRPYMRGLLTKGQFRVAEGKFGQAAPIFERMIELNNNDNLGARYYLMAIYALLEDQKKAEKLRQKYPNDLFFMTFSLFVLYYKLNMQKEADRYFKQSLKYNEYVPEYFANNIKMLTATLQRYDSYQVGSREEVAVYVQDFGFLLRDVRVGVANYIREYRKRCRKK